MTREEFDARAPKRHTHNPRHYTAAFRRYTVLNTRGMSAAEAAVLAGVSLRSIQEWRRVGDGRQRDYKVTAETVHAAWTATRSAEAAERAATQAAQTVAVLREQLAWEQQRRQAAEAVAADLVARLDALERQVRCMENDRRNARRAA